MIRDLDPKPGFELMTEEVRYITPDLIVERVGDDYVVFLNDKNIPRLRVSNAYKRELDRGSTNGTKETRDFILGRLSSARWLIQTIEQRRKTMVKVMECIVDEQRDFFEKGPAHLRPLTLQQVASRIGMHESTVSRVTTNKYVQTPRGVFELKYFFSSSLDTEDGEEVSAKAAKTRIREIIAQEDLRKPLSDHRKAHGRQVSGATEDSAGASAEAVLIRLPALEKVRLPDRNGSRGPTTSSGTVVFGRGVRPTTSEFPLSVETRSGVMPGRFLFAPLCSTYPVRMQTFRPGSGE